jgi:hypothetical protein
MDNTPPSIISTYCDLSRVLYKQGSHLKVSLMKKKSMYARHPTGFSTEETSLALIVRVEALS